MSHYNRDELEEMASKNRVSMLEGLDLKDPDAVRRFMQGLEYHLTHTVLNVNYDTMLGLGDFELAKIANIIACIRENGLAYPILAEATIRFVAQRHRDPKTVMVAGWEFDEFASEAALTIPYMYPHEYSVAEARMVDLRGSIDIMRVSENLHDLIPGAFSDQVYHLSRSIELEKMAKDYGGDIRSIDPKIQLKPHPIPEGASAKNPESCYHCTRDDKYCDRVEPKCRCCRERWLKCSYDNPVLKEKDDKDKNAEKTAEVVEGDEDIQFDEDDDVFYDFEDLEGDQGDEDHEGIEDNEISEDDGESVGSSIFGPALKPPGNRGARTIVASNNSAELGSIERIVAAKLAAKKLAAELAGKKFAAEKPSAEKSTQRPVTEQSATEKAVTENSTAENSTTEKSNTEKPKITLKLFLGKKPAVENAAVEKGSPSKKPAAQKASVLKTTTAEKGVVGKTGAKKFTIDEKANSTTAIIEKGTLQTAPSKISTAEKVTAEKTNVEKAAADKVNVEKIGTEKSHGPKLVGPKSKPLKTETATATTSKNTKPKVATSVPAPKKTLASKAAKTLPPASDRVTRRMARSNLPSTGDVDSEPGLSVKNEDGHASAAVASNPQGTKRKLADEDDDNNNIEPGNSRPSKRAKQPVMKEPMSSFKRTSANAELDDDSNPQPPKKVKLNTNTKAPSSGTKSDGEGEKRTVRGRPEQNHVGKKCCNTCQGWKPVADFAIKKHSKTPGATVGYCKRCQANKQAKNKAKADAKKGGSQANAATSTMVDDGDDGDDYDGDAADHINDENGDEI